MWPSARPREERPILASGSCIGSDIKVPETDIMDQVAGTLLVSGVTRLNFILVTLFKLVYIIQDLINLINQAIDFIFGKEHGLV